jgi:5-methylcytosine-specific restriction protein A
MTISRVSDLPALVTCAKADWLVATTWIGFTPAADGQGAESQCQATINSQIGGGYVLEYVTLSLGTPNPGTASQEDWQEEQEAHAVAAGRLIAIHKLRPSMKPLRQIVGAETFESLQDMWAKPGARRRWSVAFPITESYSIVGQPLAKDVFTEEAYSRLFQHASATLRPLNDSERDMIAGLQLTYRPVQDYWTAVEDEVRNAEGSQIGSRVSSAIDQDLGLSAPEGMTAEQWATVRTRAKWLANKYAAKRRKEGTLYCDDCQFDPADRVAGTAIKARSLLDVHHLDPLAEGKRVTTLADFGLLCPTCHRLETLKSLALKTTPSAS